MTKKTAQSKKTNVASPRPNRLEKLAEAAQTYGNRSFHNYSQIRNVAETLRDEFCLFLDEDRLCVFLVPPKGPFAAANAGSAAFSVSGKGFLPLEPISFGLAVAITKFGDYMRLVITCRKEGGYMYISPEKGREHKLNLPINDTEMDALIEGLYAHLMEYFQDGVDSYDNGDYGNTDIGFDILRMNS